VIHQFISRAITRDSNSHLHCKEFIASFQRKIAQPHVDAFTAKINNPVLRRSINAPMIEDSDLIVDGLREMSLTVHRSDQVAKTSSVSTPHNPGTTAAKALDFGPFVEEGLVRLGVSEVIALKLKLIVSRVEDENHWVAMFREVGLSGDTAPLVALIMTRSAEMWNK
jgi:hypothetical protein